MSRMSNYLIEVAEMAGLNPCREWVLNLVCTVMYDQNPADKDALVEAVKAEAIKFYAPLAREFGLEADDPRIAEAVYNSENDNAWDVIDDLLDYGLPEPKIEAVA